MSPNRLDRRDLDTHAGGPWLVRSVAILTTLLFQSTACGEHRTALLIGNARYAGKTTLASPETDIELVAEALAQFGVRSKLMRNLSAEELHAAVDQFVKSAPINGTAIIYFSGKVTSGKTFDDRPTAVLSGIDAEEEGLSAIELTQWLHLHCATAQNVIVLDGCRQLPRGRVSDYGMSRDDLPSNTWLGLASSQQRSGTEDDRVASVFATRLLSSNQEHLAKRLTAACGWSKSTCRKLPFSESISKAVAPPEVFPGYSCQPGDEWVSPDGTVFCYCPPNREGPGFWIGKYEAPLCKWPIPGLFKGIGEHRNDPTTEQPPSDVVTRLADLTEVERNAGRIPQEWEYALPSPQQWEHAALAGTDGPRYFDVADLVHHANFADRTLLESGSDQYLYADATRCDRWAGLAPVGSYRPNPWGLHDVFGNVWEQTDSGVLCGGSWVSLPGYCRAGVRKPSLKYPSDYVGLRVVLRPVRQ